MPRPPVGTTGASLSRFWAVSGPGGGRTQPRPIDILQPFLGARAPMHGQPNICATQGAPGVSFFMVLGYIHPVSVVSSILVLTVSEPFLSREVGRDALELGGDGRHALGHDVGIGWHGVRRGAAVWAGGEAREVGPLHAVDVVGLLHAAREAARPPAIHRIVADRADLLGLLLDLLLRLASQPTLNAGLSLNLQVERGR